MIRNGYDVLCNESQWKRWMKKYCLYNAIGSYDNDRPREFPCIAFSRIGADENGYAEFVYESDVRQMLEALKTAHGTKV